METKLWEDIKIGSFTQLFVTAYALAAICVLLRVQMHILARSSDSFTNIQSETITMSENQNLRTHDFDDDGSALNPGNGSQMPSQKQSNDAALKQLIDGTYKHIFSTGLRTLSSIVRQQVSSDFKEWKVKEKAVVEYGELVQVLASIRRAIESDVANLIKIMIIRKLTFRCWHSVGVIDQRKGRSAKRSRDEYARSNTHAPSSLRSSPLCP